MDPAVVQRYFAGEGVLDYYARAAAGLGLWVSEEVVFRQVFQPQDALLEVGTGAGRIAFGLWELGYQRVLGIDFSRAMIERARHLARLLEYEVPFQVMDATALTFGEEVFDGAIFGFNGLMQIPGRERRRLALRQIHRALAPGAALVFTTHDRDWPPRRAFWMEEECRWAEGQQDGRLAEFGDRFEETNLGGLFIHIPDRSEVVEDLAATGFHLEFDRWRSEIANEPADVREFSDECRFWVARKPDPA